MDQKAKWAKSPFLDCFKKTIKRIRRPDRVKVSWCVKNGRLVIFSQAGMCRDLATYHVQTIFDSLKIVCAEPSRVAERRVIELLEDHATVLQRIASTFECVGFNSEYLLKVKQFRVNCLLYNELTIAYFGVKYTKAQIYFLMHATAFHLLSLCRHSCEVSTTSEEALEMIHCIAKQYNKQIVPMVSQSQNWSRAHQRLLELLYFRIENICDEISSPADAYRNAGRAIAGQSPIHSNVDDVDDANVEEESSVDDADDEDNNDAGFTIGGSDFSECPTRLEVVKGRCPKAVSCRPSYIEFHSPDFCVTFTSRTKTTRCMGRRASDVHTTTIGETNRLNFGIVGSKRLFRWKMTSGTFEVSNSCIRNIEVKALDTSSVCVAIDFAQLDVTDAPSDAPLITETFLETVSRITVAMHSKMLDRFKTSWNYLGLSATERAPQEELSSVLSINDPENLSLRRVNVVRSNDEYPVLSFAGSKDETRKRFLTKIAQYHKDTTWIKDGYFGVKDADRSVETFSFCACGQKVALNLFGASCCAKIRNGKIEIVYSKENPHGVSHEICPVAVPLGNAGKAPELFFRKMRRAKASEILN